MLRAAPPGVLHASGGVNPQARPSNPHPHQAEERDCENKLVVLLDYDKFDLIKLLLKHRWKVAACTQLAQAQNDAAKEALLRKPARRKWPLGRQRRSSTAPPRLLVLGVAPRTLTRRARARADRRVSARGL